MVIHSPQVLFFHSANISVDSTLLRVRGIEDPRIPSFDVCPWTYIKKPGVLKKLVKTTGGNSRVPEHSLAEHLFREHLQEVQASRGGCVTGGKGTAQGMWSVGLRQQRMGTGRRRPAVSIALGAQVWVTVLHTWLSEPCVPTLLQLKRETGEKARVLQGSFHRVSGLTVQPKFNILHNNPNQRGHPGCTWHLHRM